MNNPRKPTRSRVLSPDELDNHPRYHAPIDFDVSTASRHDSDRTRTHRTHRRRTRDHVPNDGIAHLARMIEHIAGNGIEPDETEKLIIAIRRAGLLDGPDLTRRSARYLRKRNAEPTARYTYEIVTGTD